MTTTQLDIFAPPALEHVDVPVCREVLIRGAGAMVDPRDLSKGRLFEHRYVPPLPATMKDTATWLDVLDFCEDARRYNQAGRARLDLSERAGAGSNGPIGTSHLWANARGIESSRTGNKATWPAMLKGRRLQREQEPEIARARDLAEAYHYLDYYGEVYAGQPERDDWRAADFVAAIAADVLELGGDPTLVEPRTDYMREGIEAATS